MSACSDTGIIVKDIWDHWGPKPQQHGSFRAGGHSVTGRWVRAGLVALRPTHQLSVEKEGATAYGPQNRHAALMMLRVMGWGKQFSGGGGGFNFGGGMQVGQGGVAVWCFVEGVQFTLFVVSLTSAGGALVAWASGK